MNHLPIALYFYFTRIQLTRLALIHYMAQIGETLCDMAITTSVRKLKDNSVHGYKHSLIHAHYYLQTFEQCLNRREQIVDLYKQTTSAVVCWQHLLVL